MAGANLVRAKNAAAFLLAREQKSYILGMKLEGTEKRGGRSEVSLGPTELEMGNRPIGDSCSLFQSSHGCAMWL